MAATHDGEVDREDPQQQKVEDSESKPKADGSELKPKPDGNDLKPKDGSELSSKEGTELKPEGSELKPQKADGDDPKSQKVQRGPSRRCRHWARGMCKRGDTCSFLHTGAAGVHVPCRHFVRTGSCRRGNLCDFKHDARLAYEPTSSYPPPPPFGSFLHLYPPLPSPSFYTPPSGPSDNLRAFRKPGQSPDNQPFLIPNRSPTSPMPCRHWQNGLCRLGKACGFTHDGQIPQKFRTTPCRHWLKGACRLGEACGFAHPTDV